MRHTALLAARRLPALSNYLCLVRRAAGLGLVGLTLTACDSLTAPQTQRTLGAAEPAETAEPTKIRASHILIAFQGSRAARGGNITRTKDEALKLAERIRSQAKQGGDFSQLAKQHSDEPRAKQSGGDLGEFAKGDMVREFAEAAFKLRPGEISPVVETPFGFHVIKRAE